MRWVLGSMALAFVVGAYALSARGGEPPDPRDLPGGWPPGRLDCRWVAPYVARYASRVGDRETVRTVWYAKDGSEQREANSSGERFVAIAQGGGWIVHGTLAPWTITLPPSAGSEGSNLFFDASLDGRTFLRETRTDEGKSSADLWLDGDRVGHVGPLPAWKGSSFQVGQDGSLAVLTASEDAATGVGVVVFAPRAKLSFKAACGENDTIVAVAPDGRGVVVSRWHEAQSDDFIFISPSGTRKLSLGTSPNVVTWVPSSSRALVVHGPEPAIHGRAPREPMRLRLVEFETGVTLWDVEDQPLGGKRGWPGAVVEGDLVLLSGLEPHGVPPDGASHWLRRIDALDLTTGARVATWRSIYTGAVGYAEAPVFARSGGRLWLVARDMFAPVSIADIRAKQGGWE